MPIISQTGRIRQYSEMGFPQNFGARSGGGAGRGVAEREDGQLSSLLLLLATDLFAVCLRSSLQSLRPPPALPRSSIDADIARPAGRSQHTEEQALKIDSSQVGVGDVDETSLTKPTIISDAKSSESTKLKTKPTSSKSQSIHASTEFSIQHQIPNKPFIKSVKGLPNRGQTCYANSVLQALASLSPICTYLEKMQLWHIQSHQSDGAYYNQSIVSSLFETLQHINGHETTRISVPTNRRSVFKKAFLSFTSLSSLSSRPSLKVGDPQQIMDMIAQRHSQFRSRSNNCAGMTEQQDAHEFFSALVDILSLDDHGGNNSNTTALNCLDKGLVASSDDFLALEQENERECTCLKCQKKSTRPDSSHSKSEANTEYVTDDIDTNCREGTLHHPARSRAELQEEKKHDESMNANNSFGRLRQSFHSPQSREKISTSNSCEYDFGPKLDSANSRSACEPIQNPFDGWSGSTIKCATCHHIRPIRSTPFLCVSLAIATSHSSSLEDFLATEYGGFANPERVTDVQCMSCAILKHVQNLEEEELLVTSAISSVQRRNRGKKHQRQHQPESSGSNSNNPHSPIDERGVKSPEGDILGLVKESQQISIKISMLKSLDPDADDDDMNAREQNEESNHLIDEEFAKESLPRIIPLRGDAYKASLLVRSPTVLCVHLQRRHYDIRCQQMVKVVKRVEFPEVLDVSKYCAYGKNSFEQQSRTSSTGRCDERDAANSMKHLTMNIHYKLMSVIEHKGNAFGGHYQTYRRIALDSASQKKNSTDKNQLRHQKGWALVSDESVSFRTWNDVTKCQAYMLFYVKMS